MFRTPSSSGRRPPGLALFLSFALHLSLLAVGWWLHTATFSAPVYQTYEITIVSVADPDRPEVVALPEPDPLVVETPDPQLPVPEPEPPPPPPAASEDRVAVPRPDPAPPVERPPPEPPRPQPERPAPQPQTQVPPEATDPQANVDLAVRMEGLQRDFPAYYARILAAMQVCWRQPPGIERASATVRFAIERDGSIRSRSIQIHVRSGVGPFDLRAVEAVECAGQNQRIPVLPDEIPGSSLPVQFTFTTSGFRE